VSKSNLATIPAAINKVSQGSRVLARGRTVGTHPATIFVGQPIDPFFTRLACTTFLHVCIRARPVAQQVSSLFNRPQGKNMSCSLPGWFRVDAAKGVCVTHRTLLIFPTRPIRPPWSLGLIIAASIRVQQSRMGKNWVTTGVKSHSDTLSKRHTPARVR
jgi:hypothetical protein